MSKPKLLKVAIENRHWDLAAHALVLGAVQTKVEEVKKELFSAPMVTPREGSDSKGLVSNEIGNPGASAPGNAVVNVLTPNVSVSSPDLTSQRRITI